MLWAFAREGGVPLSKYIARVSSPSPPFFGPPINSTHPFLCLGVVNASSHAQVNSRTSLPIYSILTTVIINMLLALINIGSSVGFDAFISLIVAGYYSSFILAASVMLHKRLTTPDSELSWGPFRLGRAGPAITVVAIAYSVVVAFFSMWPQTVKPDAESMNYCVLVFAAVLLFSMGFWLVYGRKHYTGPVIEISGHNF